MLPNYNKTRRGIANTWFGATDSSVPDLGA